MKQERISALENVEYDAWTVKTLRKLAKALDTGLQVSFVPFSASIMSIVNVSRKTLEILPRTDDLSAFRRHKIVMSSGHWKAIDGRHLAPVQPLVSHQPIQPKPSWQPLPSPQVTRAVGR